MGSATTSTGWRKKVHFWTTVATALGGFLFGNTLYVLGAGLSPWSLPIYFAATPLLVLVLVRIWFCSRRSHCVTEVQS
jgi:hypothetical protein